MSENNNGRTDLTSPCHSARLQIHTVYVGGHLGQDEPDEISCTHPGCNNTWDPSGVADDFNRAGNDAPTDAAGSDAAAIRDAATLGFDTLAALVAKAIRSSHGKEKDPHYGVEEGEAAARAIAAAAAECAR